MKIKDYMISKEEFKNKLNEINQINKSEILKLYNER